MSSAQERLRLREELRDEVAWRTTMLIDEPPDDAPTGRQFDLFLLAYISDLLTDLEQGPMGIVECERIIGTVERGLNSDPEIKAFKKNIEKAGQAPLAWRTIFDLTQRGIATSRRLTLTGVTVAVCRSGPTPRQAFHLELLSPVLGAGGLPRRGMGRRACSTPRSLFACSMWEGVGEFPAVGSAPYRSHGPVLTNALLWETHNRGSVLRRAISPAAVSNGCAPRSETVRQLPRVSRSRGATLRR